jgi:hypothetical protein
VRHYYLKYRKNCIVRDFPLRNSFLLLVLFETRAGTYATILFYIISPDEIRDRPRAVLYNGGSILIFEKKMNLKRISVNLNLGRFSGEWFLTVRFVRVEA